LEIEGSGIDELKMNDMAAVKSDEKQPFDQEVSEFTLPNEAKNLGVMIRYQANLVFDCIILVFLLFLVSNLPMLTDELLAGGGRMSHEMHSRLGSKAGRALDVNTLNQMASMVGKAVKIYELFNN
jgi:hypothetical protein